MDISEARRQLIVRAIKDHFDGKQALFAERAGISASYLSRMLKDPAEGGQRKAIGQDIAAKIEAKVDQLRGKLMDPVLDRGEPHAGVSADVRAAPGIVEAIRSLGKALAQADESSRIAIGALIGKLASKPEAADQVARAITALVGGTVAPAPTGSQAEIERRLAQISEINEPQVYTSAAAALSSVVTRAQRSTPASATRKAREPSAPATGKPSRKPLRTR